MLCGLSRPATVCHTGSGSGALLWGKPGALFSWCSSFYRLILGLILVGDHFLFPNPVSVLLESVSRTNGQHISGRQALELFSVQSSAGETSPGTPESTGTVVPSLLNLAVVWQFLSNSIWSTYSKSTIPRSYSCLWAIVAPASCVWLPLSSRPLRCLYHPLDNRGTPPL